METKKLIDLLDKLNEKDIYSAAMFLLSKLEGVPKYAIISELPYLLDKEGVFKLCKYYGGKTIKIPTLDELKDAMKLLLVMQFYRVDGKSWTESLECAGYSLAESKSVSSKLVILEQMLEQYNFSGDNRYE